MKLCAFEYVVNIISLLVVLEITVISVITRYTVQRFNSTDRTVMSSVPGLYRVPGTVPFAEILYHLYRHI